MIGTQVIVGGIDEVVDESLLSPCRRRGRVAQTEPAVTLPAPPADWFSGHLEQLAIEALDHASMHLDGVSSVCCRIGHDQQSTPMQVTIACTSDTSIDSLVKVSRVAGIVGSGGVEVSAHSIVVEVSNGAPPWMVEERW